MNKILPLALMVLAFQRPARLTITDLTGKTLINQENGVSAVNSKTFLPEYIF